MFAFSELSLQRILDALSAVEKTNPHFTCSVSKDELHAGEGWGQGIDIYFLNGEYYCRHRRERSTDIEPLESEDMAVTCFINYCTVTMKS